MDIGSFNSANEIQERVWNPSGLSQIGCSQDDPGCEKDEGPIGGTAVAVPAFSIDRYEVAVTDYRHCTDAGKCDRPTGQTPSK
jgi:formylglycine-generating enzyme required for sulfatase activity